MNSEVIAIEATSFILQNILFLENIFSLNSNQLSIKNANNIETHFLRMKYDLKGH